MSLPNSISLESDSLEEHIKNGSYFSKARTWYVYKYVHPFSYRSLVFLLTFTVSILFLIVVLNIYKLFPIVVQIKYLIQVNSDFNKSAQIVRANQIANQPDKSIADIMLRKYVTQRESYDYDNLKRQFTFLKNNSTRLVFRKFYNFMNIDNPSSPVLMYQKQVKCTIDILAAEYLEGNKAIVKFNSIAKNDDGEVIENLIKQATIEYEIDQINTDLPPGTRFNFLITSYNLELVENRTIK